MPTPTASPSITDWISTASSVIYTFLTLVLVIFAATAWIQAKKALNASERASAAAEKAAQAQEKANQQAEADSKARTRPYVTGEVVPGLQGPASYDFRIRNAGQSAARFLRIECSPDPHHEDFIVVGVSRMFGTARTLAPNSAIRILWRYREDDQQSFGMPETVRITIRYKDEEGLDYSDEYELHCDDSDLWPVPEEGDPPMRDLSPELLAFYKLFQALVRRVGELSR